MSWWYGKIQRYHRGENLVFIFFQDDFNDIFFSENVRFPRSRTPSFIEGGIIPSEYALFGKTVSFSDSYLDCDYPGSSVR